MALPLRQAQGRLSEFPLENRTRMSSQAQERIPKVGMFAALESQNFRRFWYSALGQSAAMGMQTLTISWLILELTGSKAQFGISVFLQGLPMSIAVIFGGMLADRMNRVRLIQTGQIVNLVLLTLLGVLVLMRHIRVWQVYLIIPLIGTFQGLANSSRGPLVNDLVERKDIMNAVSLNSMLMNITQIAGPSAAGFIISAVGVGPSLLINASLYSISIFWLSRIKYERKKTVNLPKPLKHLVEGMRYVKSVPAIFGIITIGCIMGLFAHPAQQMVPVLVKDEFGLGARAAGFLLMSAGIGALIGNVALASLGAKVNKNAVLLTTGATYAIGIWAMAASPWYASSLVALFLMGLSRSVFVSVGSTLLQLIAHKDYLGKSLSWWNVGGSFPFVGAMPLGFLADEIGLRTAIAVWLMVYVAVFIWVGLIGTGIRKIEAAPKTAEVAVRA